MPDILIRGMEMPGSCYECVIKHKFFRELKCADLPGMRNFGENRLYTDNRNPYCPLHELPPHGDLIDMDKIQYTELYGGIEVTTANWIDSLPVIVPAEREGET